MIDLRSDTVTLPSDEMRKAIVSAKVGDDQFGEDPSVNKLQEITAELLGKESAIFLPSGTMSNQVALRVLTSPGDDVIASRESHAVWHETGAAAANSGVQFTEIGSNGIFSLDEFLSAKKPRGHIIYPPTTLLEIENTHNRAGGVIFPQDEIIKICDEAKKNNIASFLDGARIWNAAIASGKLFSVLAAPFDLVSVSLSKGLGAPGGSILAGSKELIIKAVRYRRMFGGAMRQIGFLAAAGIYALQNNINRIIEDHENAKLIANILAENPKIKIDLKTVQTNIVIFHLNDNAPDAETVVKRAKEKGVLIFSFGPRTIRAVTHLNVTKDQCRKAAEILSGIVKA